MYTIDMNNPNVIAIYVSLLIILIISGVVFTSFKRITPKYIAFMQSANTFIFALFIYLSFVILGYVSPVLHEEEGFTAVMSMARIDPSNSLISDISLNLNGTIIPIHFTKSIKDATYSITSDENVIIDIIKNPTHYFTETPKSNVAMTMFSDASGTNADLLPPSFSFF